MISKTFLPFIIYLTIPYIILISSINIHNNKKIDRLYYSKYLYSYKQDIINNNIGVIICIILSIIGGIIYYIYVHKNYNNIIKLLTLIFIILYIFELSFPMTKYSNLHTVLFILLVLFSQMYFIIILYSKKSIIKYTGYIFILLSFILFLIITLYYTPKAYNKNENKKVKYTKIENILIIILLNILSILIYLVGF
jgi:magnesium-transporting ATPase (P-type)